MNKFMMLVVVGALSSSPTIVFGDNDVKSVIRDETCQTRFEKLVPLANAGDVDAQRSLGEMYQEGGCLGQDMVVSNKWLFMSAAKGDIDSILDLMFQSPYLENKQSDSEIEALKKLGNSGDIYAQYKLAQIYGVKPDGQMTKERIFWLEKAAANSTKKDLGSALAMATLGDGYYAIETSVRDYELAFKWYSMAVDNDSVHAMVKLGDMYRFGQGVKVDPKKALELYMKASKNFDAEAYSSLGDFYYIGDGGKVDYKESAKCYQSLGQSNLLGWARLGKLSAMGLLGGDLEEAKAKCELASQRSNKSLQFFTRRKDWLNNNQRYMVDGVKNSLTIAANTSAECLNIIAQKK